MKNHTLTLILSIIEALRRIVVSRARHTRRIYQASLLLAFRIFGKMRYNPQSVWVNDRIGPGRSGGFWHRECDSRLSTIASETLDRVDPL
jgi:hypothetical protein